MKPLGVTGTERLLNKMKSAFISAHGDACPLVSWQEEAGGGSSPLLLQAGDRAGLSPRGAAFLGGHADGLLVLGGGGMMQAWKGGWVSSSNENRILCLVIKKKKHLIKKLLDKIMRL